MKNSPSKDIFGALVSYLLYNWVLFKIFYWFYTFGSEEGWKFLFWFFFSLKVKVAQNKVCHLDPAFFYLEGVWSQGPHFSYRDLCLAVCLFPFVFWRMREWTFSARTLSDGIYISLLPYLLCCMVKPRILASPEDGENVNCWALGN